MRTPALRVICSCALNALALACAGRVYPRPAYQPTFLTVTGFVTSEESGQPAEGVRIRIYLSPIRETGTDARGMYRLDSIPWGAHKVVADGFGYMREERMIEPSCTVTVVDSVGRVLSQGRCSDPVERLNFSMRRQKLHGRDLE